LSAGEPCQQDSWCANGHCVDGDCNDDTPALDACAQDVQCASGLCCPVQDSTSRVCRDGSACPGVIGSPCNVDADCLSNVCFNGFFCSRSCTTDGECGINPFRAPITGTALPNLCIDTMCQAGCAFNSPEVCVNYGLVCDQVETPSRYVCVE
jgi:hypothetical protein